MNLETSKYYSHGKLLITGEYTVLYGAAALALPAKFGQVMKVKKDAPEGTIQWRGHYKGEVFMEAAFSAKDLQLLNQEENQKTRRLQEILHAVREIRPEFAAEGGYNIDTELEFPLTWGLGSSSTLLANIAQWAEIDPFELNRRVSEGSGYDIACATSNAPVHYALSKNKPDFKTIDFNPPFKDRLYFIYQGKKQSSDEEVHKYLKNFQPDTGLVAKISNITDQVLRTRSIDRFNALMQQHEALMGEHLGQTPIQQHAFPDFNGVIKSLGAWGGDFMMATCKHEQDLREYFAGKGLDTVMRWDEIIL